MGVSEQFSGVEEMDSKWIVIAVVAVSVGVVGDLLTTAYGLGVGLEEQNGFALYVLENWGIMGLVGVKVVAISWVVFIWKRMGCRYGVAAAAGLALPQLIAVVLNISAILIVL